MLSGDLEINAWQHRINHSFVQQTLSQSLYCAEHYCGPRDTEISDDVRSGGKAADI